MNILTDQQGRQVVLKKAADQQPRNFIQPFGDNKNSTLLFL